MAVRVPLTRQATGPASLQAVMPEQDDLWSLQPVAHHKEFPQLALFSQAPSSIPLHA